LDLKDVGAHQLDLSINLLDTQPLQLLGNHQKCIFSKKRKKKCKKNSYTPKRSSCSKCGRFVTSIITYEFKHLKTSMLWKMCRVGKKVDSDEKETENSETKDCENYRLS
jgi:hypothetical protein